MKLVVFFLFVCLFSVLSSGPIAWSADGAQRVYIGTYSNGKQGGIFVVEMDPPTGTMSRPRLAAEAVNPSFLAISPNRKFLYAVAEVSLRGGRKTGGVIAFAIDETSGVLRRLNDQSSQGAGPCYLVVDKSGRNILVANYDGGTVAVLPIGERGHLKPAPSVIVHHGKSINPERQERAHAHSINLDAANRFAIAADLGLDKLLMYRFDPISGSLSANDPPAVKVAPGSGPRHFAFHPSGRVAYLINELANTIIAFDYDAGAGTLREIQTVSTLPADFTGASYAAEVVVHPSGRFVYGSNRGHDSLAIFSVEPATGKLVSQGHESTQGKNPRNFNIDPTGRHLLAANMDSGTVVGFRIDQTTGKLTATGQVINVPKPVCIKFLSRETP